VKVVEQSIMWKETETYKIFTYHGLTTCTELDKSWTIMSSIYNHLRQGKDKSTSELKTVVVAGLFFLFLLRKHFITEIFF